MKEKQLLINFAVNNDKLERLKARTNRFNPLKVLKVQDYEIRHSNILAWLFDPSQNHNLDDRILKRFLLKVLLRPDNDELLDNMDIVYQLQQESLNDVKVFRENSHIDILLVSESHKTLILIENKVYSGEGLDQLMRYFDKVKSDYADYFVIPIFLTLDGAQPTHKKYFSGSYDDVLDAIEFVKNEYKNRTSPEVIAFLEYYIEILKEKYAMDDELKKLCKEIYLENKEAIDMIYAEGNQIDIGQAIENFDFKYPEVEALIKKNRTFWFVLDSFTKSKNSGIESWGGGYPVCLWFSEYYGRLKLTLEVGPFNDVEKRIRFLNSLISMGLDISERAKEPTRKYTRIYTETCPIKDWTDSEEILEVMEKLYKSELFEKKIAVMVKTIDEFEW